MRDPERINEILSLIKSIWVYIPDLRLMQLLINALPVAKAGISNDYYYVEDAILIKYLKKFLKNIKENSI